MAIGNHTHFVLAIMLGIENKMRSNLLVASCCGTILAMISECLVPMELGKLKSNCVMPASISILSIQAHCMSIIPWDLIPVLVVRSCAI
jgi:hypothetical protein